MVSIPNLTFVAWEELAPNDAGFKIFVRFFLNGAWTNLGTQADGSIDSGSSPKLAVNANNRMALTYFQDSPLGGRVVVRRWGAAPSTPCQTPVRWVQTGPYLASPAAANPSWPSRSFQGVRPFPNWSCGNAPGRGTGCNWVRP